MQGTAREVGPAGRKGSIDYVIQVFDDPAAIDAAQWNSLLDMQPSAMPFMRHEYLLALHASASAVPATGWAPQFITVSLGGELVAACASSSAFQACAAMPCGSEWTRMT